MSWSQWSESVGDPQLAVDPNVAREVVKACTVLLGEFDSMKGDVGRLAAVTGMGTFQSGIDLARKFSEKAVGGEDSLENALRSHVHVVTEMRDFFQKCVDRYESADASNAMTLRSAEIPG
ncbi:hypothetical protein B2J88_17495 [Rhodococcus sp. SRB_17]|nr:hypothetical protein [Rhodococcus sp. SRB_17]